MYRMLVTTLLCKRSCPRAAVICVTKMVTALVTILVTIISSAPCPCVVPRVACVSVSRADAYRVDVVFSPEGIANAHNIRRV